MGGGGEGGEGLLLICLTTAISQIALSEVGYDLKRQKGGIFSYKLFPFQVQIFTRFMKKYERFREGRRPIKGQGLLKVQVQKGEHTRYTQYERCQINVRAEGKLIRLYIFKNCNICVVPCDTIF